MIAQKYARAILAQHNADEFYERLKAVLPAFEMPKFRLILESSEISKEEKFTLLKSLCEESGESTEKQASKKQGKKNKAEKTDKLDENFVNFLRILAQNSRFLLIPQILKELSRQRALKEQLFEGIVYSEKPLKKDDLMSLESKLSKKFALSIKLHNESTQNQGIKISLDELGYEIAFSKQNLKAKMSEFILKNM